MIRYYGHHHLFIPGTNREQVDKPQGGVLLHRQGGLGPETLADFGANVANDLLELPRFLEFLSVYLGFEVQRARECVLL